MENTDSHLKVHALHYANELLVGVRSSFQKLLQTRSTYIRVQTTINHVTILPYYSSAIADHMTQTGHRINWDHFNILATGQSDIHCKIKETFLIRDLKPALNENVGSEKLLLY